MFCCDGAVLDALLRLGLERRRRAAARRAGVGVAQREVGEGLLDLGARLRALGLVAEAHDDVGCLRARRRAYWTFFSRSSERMSVV